ACWLIGNMYDLFMTRYMLTGIVPLTALGLTSVVLALAGNGGLRRAAVGIAAVAIVAWQAVFGWNLIATTEYRGFTKFLSGFAQEVRDANGVLLCEYSRVGAPLEHMFGIPTLGLDNETRSDYSKAIDAWGLVLKAHPGKRAFFLTPFQAPASDKFSMRLVKSGTAVYPRLRSELFRLPGKAGKGDISLDLYEMSPVIERWTSLPYVRCLDAGNMGLKGFGGERVRRWDISGLQVGPEAVAKVRVESGKEPGGEWRLLMFFLNDSGRTEPVAPVLSLNGGEATASGTDWKHLAGDWWLMMASGSSGCISNVDVSARQDMLLTDITLEAGSACSSLKPVAEPGQEKTIKSQPWSGRWAGEACEFLAPEPGGGESWLLVLAQGRKESSGPVGVTIDRSGRVVVTADLRAGEWTWLAAPVKKPGPDMNGSGWYRVRTGPRAVDDNEAAVRLACVAVVQAPEQQAVGTDKTGH
ncbi:MAG: hypothetical protein WCL44_13385, partial [bacterium]